MIFRRTSAVAAAIVFIAISDASAQQQRRPEWVPLGCYEILGGGREVGQIRVDTSNNKQFHSVRLSATGSNIRMRELKVTFPTDKSDDVPVDAIAISSGSQTGALDLEGTSHEIREIEMIFKSTATTRGVRKLCVDGLTAFGPERNWKEIGCHTVDFDRPDTDKIRPTRELGYVEAVRLNARDNDVRVMNFKVTYFDNSSEKLTVNPRDIRKDRRSRRINLSQGSQQRIREIELNYFAIPNSNGRAVVCVEGLVVAGPPQRPTNGLENIPGPEAGWERFECQTVDAAADAAKIYVGQDKGRFSAIQVQAFQNTINIQKLDVNIANRQRDRLHFERFIVRKDTGSVVPFENRRAYRIDTIDVTYQSQRADGSAVICLNGRRAENSSVDPDRDPDQDRDRDRPQGQANWKLIGCQTVKTTVDFDVYIVGRDEGNYSAIRFYALRNDVVLRKVRIAFEAGAYEEFSMTGDSDNNVVTDRPTPAIDLRGDRRIIRLIEMTYKSGSDSRRDAILCIEGQPGRSTSSEGGGWRREPISIR